MTAAGVWSAHADTEARRKARYYYSAGIVEQARGNDDRAYEYFKKSFEADPAYPEGAWALANYRLYINTDTMQSETELGRSLEMLRQYVDSYPDDVNEALTYGFVAGQMGQTEDAVRVLERAYASTPGNGSILLELSDVYARAYDLDNAVKAIDRYEQQEGLTAPVTTRKISYLLASNDTVRAIDEASRLVRSDPRDISFLLIKANVFDIIEMTDSAVAYFKKAEALDPESSAAKLAVAGYYLEKGDSIEYDNKIYEVLLTEDLDVEPKAELLARYLESSLRNNHDTARGDYLFSVLENLYPHEPRVLDLAARYSAAKQDFAAAEEHISYAIDLEPDNNVFWGQLMAYQAAADSLDKALDTFERSKEHIVPDDNLKFYYVTVAQQAKKYDKAVGMLDEMIRDIDPRLSPDSLLSLSDMRKDISLRELDMLSSLFTLMGDTYNLAAMQSESFRAYENAITLDSSNAMAKNNYAYFMSVNGGDLDKALALSEAALSGDDADNPTYLDTYAWINHLMGNDEKAAEVQKKAVDIAEEKGYRSAELYDHYGDILLKQGNVAEAADAWRKAVALQEELEETDEPSYKETINKIKQNESAAAQ